MILLMEDVRKRRPERGVRDASVPDAVQDQERTLGHLYTCLLHPTSPPFKDRGPQIPLPPFSNFTTRQSCASQAGTEFSNRK